LQFLSEEYEIAKQVLLMKSATLIRAIYISRRRVRAFVKQYGLDKEIKDLAASLDPVKIQEFTQLVYSSV